VGFISQTTASSEAIFRVEPIPMLTEIVIGDWTYAVYESQLVRAALFRQLRPKLCRAPPPFVVRSCGADKKRRDSSATDEFPSENLQPGRSGVARPEFHPSLSAEEYWCLWYHGIWITTAHPTGLGIGEKDKKGNGQLH
jgi:hypothetical protein